MFNIGASELILVLILALVIFGPKKLPEMGKAIGSGIREFKKASRELEKSIELEEESDSGEQKSEKNK